MRMHIIGIDEVGRGPLAGPVVVACVLLPDAVNLKSSGLPLRDSKKLTEKQRAAWNAWIRGNPAIRFHIARSNPKTIDAMNISAAANRAAYRAYKKIVPHNAPAQLDAGLKLPQAVPQKAIIQGDEKIPAIALASILAKVARDAYMERMHARHPVYGFKENKGYGTAAHVKALKRHGPCPLHRLTFIKKFVNMKSTLKPNEAIT